MKKDCKPGNKSSSFSITLEESYFRGDSVKAVVTSEPIRNKVWWRKVLVFFGLKRFGAWTYTVKPHIPTTK